MSFVPRAAWLACALVCAGSPAAAQVRDTAKADTVFRIGEILVRAARPVTMPGGASAIAVRLDSLRLAPVPSLAQVLREVPVIHVRTNSRGEAEITMRGSESRQVAVLVDGVPLTLGWDSRTDVSVVSALAPRELTIVRGLSSVLYGPNTLGGIVELNVAAGDLPSQPRSAQWSAGVDHVGGYGLSGTFAQPIPSAAGQWLLRGGAGYRSSPGATLADGVSEPVPAGDGLRLNTDVAQVDGFLSARYSAENGAWASFSGSVYRAERGVAAELGVAEPRLWRYPLVARGIAAISAGTGHHDTPFGGRGDLEASFGIDIGRTEIDGYDSRAYENVIEEEDGDDRTFTARLLGDHTLGARGDLRGAFTYADVSHEERLTDEAAAEYRQRLWSVGLESAWHIVADGAGVLDNLRLSAGAVFDMADTPETGGRPALDRLDDWGGRIGITAAVSGGDALLHAGASRRARFPALRELYSGALGRFEPNPHLSPERLVATEAGVTTRLGAGEVQAVVFHHRLSDAVLRIRTPEGNFRRVNRDEIRSTGLELIASGRLGPFALAADLTLQDVELIDPTAGLSREPENQPSLFGSVDARFALPFDVRAGTEARFTGRQFCIDPDTGGDRELDAGTRVNADAARTWTVGQGLLSRIETSVAVENALGTAVFDQCGLPEAGRLVRVEVRVF